jgi:L-gulonate 3-dehydrogenase
LIGQSWAMIFASVGYQVSIYDIVASQVENALKQAKAQLTKLEEGGLLRGKLTAAEQFSCISGKFKFANLRSRFLNFKLQEALTSRKQFPVHFSCKNVFPKTWK